MKFLPQNFVIINKTTSQTSSVNRKRLQEWGERDVNKARRTETSVTWMCVVLNHLRQGVHYFTSEK